MEDNETNNLRSAEPDHISSDLDPLVDRISEPSHDAGDIGVQVTGDPSTTSLEETDHRNEEKVDEDEPLPGDDQGGSVRCSSRPNKGVLSRMAMDHGGKDYRSYTSKQLAQIMQQKKDQRKTRRVLAYTLMQRVKK